MRTREPYVARASKVFRRPRYSRLAASPLAAGMSRMPSRSFSLRIFEQKRGCSQSNRVEKGGQTFFSALYTRVQRINSYTVSYDSNSERFGCIQIFFQFKSVLFALIGKVEVAQNNGLLSFPEGATLEVRNALEWHARAIANTFTMAIPCKETNNLEVVEVCQVLRKCVLLECGTEGTFLSTIPNFVETD